MPPFPAAAPSASFPGRPSLRNPRTVRRLAERGVELRPLDQELPDDHASRIETALMALFRDERDEQTFQALYEQSRGPLLAWLVGLASGRLRANDLEALLQDTFVNVYRYAQTFRDEHARSFRVWSRTIASNVLRRSRMRRRGIALEELGPGASEPSDGRGDPASSAIEQEEGRSLSAAWMILLSQYVRAWEELGPRDRAALDLIEVQGLSYAEAGARLGVGLSNMKMIMFRARRRIRAAIGGTLRAREERVRRLAG